MTTGGPTNPDRPGCGSEFIMYHWALEPGESKTFLGDTWSHPEVPPGGKVGHKHAFDLSTFTCTLHWDAEGAPATYGGHFHTVPQGTLNSLLTVIDATHLQTRFTHYHTLFIDNHKEWVSRIPPYYALAYIQRVN
jgi:hypothetical protein